MTDRQEDRLSIWPSNHLAIAYNTANPSKTLVSYSTTPVHKVADCKLNKVSRGWIRILPDCTQFLHACPHSLGFLCYVVTQPRSPHLRNGQTLYLGGCFQMPIEPSCMESHSHLHLLPLLDAALSLSHLLAFSQVFIPAFWVLIILYMYFYTCIFACGYVCVPHVCMVPMGARRGRYIPWNWSYLPDSCEPPCSAGDQTWDL